MPTTMLPFTLANATLNDADGSTLSSELPPLLARLRLHNNSFDNGRRPRRVDAIGWPNRSSLWAASSLAVNEHGRRFSFDKNSYLIVANPPLSPEQHAVAFDVLAPNIWRNMLCCEFASLDLHPPSDDIPRCHLWSDVRKFAPQHVGSVCAFHEAAATVGL